MIDGLAVCRVGLGRNRKMIIIISYKIWDQERTMPQIDIRTRIGHCKIIYHLNGEVQKKKKKNIQKRQGIKSDDNVWTGMGSI